MKWMYRPATGAAGDQYDVSVLGAVISVTRDEQLGVFLQPLEHRFQAPKHHTR